MRDITLGDTFYHFFTTRAFASGVPTQLAGSPVLSVLEENNATPITAGVSVQVDRATVTGLNQATIVATGGNGYEAAKSYAIYISTGTVGGVSVVGEVVGEFTIQASSAFTRLGAPAGASVSADILVIDNFVDDIEARLGTPSNLGSGATVAANLVDIEGQTDDIGAAGAGLTNIGTIATVTNLTNLPSIPANWLTAAGINADAFTAAKFADDVSTEFANKVWDTDATGRQTAGTFGQAIGDPGADANTIYKAVVSDATGATVGVDVVAIKAETVSLQTDTNDIQTRLPAALTADGNMKTDTLYLDGAVWYDTSIGAAGTTNYVHGTVTNPNSSIANSRTIADSVGLKRFIILNGSTVTLDQGYINYTFMGARWTLALASRAITGSHFSGADVSGLSTGTGSEFDDCLFGNVTIANDCKVYNSVFNGTWTCQAAGLFIFSDCATASGGSLTIDFGALGATTVVLRRYAGQVILANMAAGDIFEMGGFGAVTINASCTAGTVRLRGCMELVNNGSGQTVTDSSRWNEDQTLTAIEADTAEIGVAGAGLTNINLPDQTMNITGDITGNLSGSVGSVLAGVSIDVGGIISTSFAAGAIDAAAIAADAIGASELAQDAAREIADEMLNRDLAGGGSGNTRNVRNALRALRNKVSEAGGTLTVTQEDDIAPAWTATVTRSPNTNPITTVDPA